MYLYTSLFSSKSEYKLPIAPVSYRNKEDLRSALQELQESLSDKGTCFFKAADW